MLKPSTTGWSVKVRALIGTLGAVVEPVAKVIKLWRQIRPYPSCTCPGSQLWTADRAYSSIAGAFQA